MEDKREKQGGGGVVAVLIVAALLLVPVLYLLGTGPAVWLLNHGHVSVDTFQGVFGPVYYVAQKSDSATAVLDLYLNFWR